MVLSGSAFGAILGVGIPLALGMGTSTAIMHGCGGVCVRACVRACMGIETSYLFSWNLFK